MQNPDGTISLTNVSAAEYTAVTTYPNTSGLHPTADKVLIQPVEIQKKSAGGILLADQTTDKEELAQVIGTVIAMGNTCKECPEMDGIAVGDLVLYARYSGAEFPVNGIRYRIARARDIIGKATKLPDSILRGAQSSKSTFGANESAAA
tara:strand:+ start:960 stop:1406 length:447 start_codon:yes stop_codon:yes gene_type:complete